MIYKTLQRKRATRTPLKSGVNSGAPEGLADPLVTTGNRSAGKKWKIVSEALTISKRSYLQTNDKFP